MSTKKKNVILAIVGGVLAVLGAIFGPDVPATTQIVPPTVTPQEADATTCSAPCDTTACVAD